jgi:hypothetical protein
MKKSLVQLDFKPMALPKPETQVSGTQSITSNSGTKFWFDCAWFLLYVFKEFWCWDILPQKDWIMPWLNFALEDKISLDHFFKVGSLK